MYFDHLLVVHIVKVEFNINHKQRTTNKEQLKSMKKQRMMVNKKEVSSSQEYNTRKMLLKLFEHKIEIRFFSFLVKQQEFLFVVLSSFYVAIALIFNLILPSIEYRSQVPK